MRPLVRALLLATPIALPLFASGDGLAQGAPHQGAPHQAAPGPAAPQGSRALPPHAWLFGSWTGGIFPATETQGPGCYAEPTLIFTRDTVLRSSPIELSYRQRVIETVSGGNNGSVEFRFVPVGNTGGALPTGAPPDIGFGCPGGPNVLQVERRSDDEIVLTNCDQFPATLRRCH